MYEQEIQRGIAWLEAEHPEVRLDSIDLDVLLLTDWERCILGQLLGEVSCLRIIEADKAWAVQHGFHLMGGDEAEWDLLTREWVRILRARRTAPELEVEA